MLSIINVINYYCLGSPSVLLGYNPILCDCETDYLPRIDELAAAGPYPSIPDIDRYRAGPYPSIPDIDKKIPKIPPTVPLSCMKLRR